MAYVFIDAGAHAEAQNWYSGGRAEPIGRGRTIPIGPVRMTRGLTLSSLLDAMALIPPGSSAIVVSHGRDQGIALPMINGDTIGSRCELVSLLAADTTITVGGFPLPARPDAEIAPVLRMRPDQVAALRARMNRVRALRLSHVAFRACNMGRWQDALGAYRRFFGCEVSAPDLRDTYGFLDPGRPTPSPATTPPRRPDLRGTGWHMSSYSAGGGTVRIATSGGETDTHNYHADLAYDVEAAVSAWRTQYATPGGTARFAYHGMWLTSAAPGDHRIIFIGNPDYDRHVVVA